MSGVEPAGGTRSQARCSVSVVLAVLNEREGLPILVNQILKDARDDLEIVIVDDGSTDGTREWLQETARFEPRVRPILNGSPQTLTPAQCQGIDAARGDCIVIMDADLQHPPEMVPTLVSEIARGADLVVASRYVHGGAIVGRPVLRSVISWGAEWTARTLLPSARRVSDPISGLFAFRRSVYRSVNREHRGYKLLLYLLVMCQDRRIVEVPFVFRPRGNGSSKILSNVRFMRFFLTEVVLARRMGGNPVQNPADGPALPLAIVESPPAGPMPALVSPLSPRGTPTPPSFQSTENFTPDRSA
jgi:dolichol-phosphate mannosyltransferase